MSCDAALQLPTLQTELPFSVQAADCRSCGDTLFLFVGRYVTWEECLTCDRSNLLGWSSCQPGLIRAMPTSPTLPGSVNGRQMEVLE